MSSNHHGLVARDANLPALVLLGCLLEHPDKPALDAERLTATVLAVNRTTINGNSNCGVMIVRAAHLGGLDCDRATLSNGSGPALHAERLRVDQNVFLRSGFEAAGASTRVALILTDLRVDGVLVFDPVRLEHLTNPRSRLAVDS